MFPGVGLSADSYICQVPSQEKRQGTADPSASMDMHNIWLVIGHRIVMLIFSKSHLSSFGDPGRVRLAGAYHQEQEKYLRSFRGGSGEETFKSRSEIERSKKAWKR